MNKYFLLLLINVLFIFSACNMNPNKKGEVAEKSSDEVTLSEHPKSGSLLVGTNGGQMDSLYQRMTEIPLPLVYKATFIHEAPGFISLPENMQGLFHNYDKFDAHTRIARLPVYANFKPLLIIYKGEDGDDRMNIYTLSDSMEVVDRLQIYSQEKIKKTGITIRQEYEIPADYKIMSRKLLNGLMIEQLHYTLDGKRCFMEIRDGITPAVAYESPDDIYYMVESFIWDHDENGGVYKKDLTRRFYKVVNQTQIEEIREAEYQNAFK